MAQRSKSNFKSTKNTRFANNTTGQIGADDSRDTFEDVADSAMFISDNFIDEDSFASDSATKAPSQQSVKAYVESIIKTVTVTVSSAEILAIFTSPKTLLDAPASGTMYQILGISVKYIFVSNDYSSNTNLVIRQGLRNVATLDSLLMSSFEEDAWLTLPVNNPGAVGTANPENSAITLTHATGNPSGGDGTLSIGITYSIVTF